MNKMTITTLAIIAGMSFSCDAPAKDKTAATKSVEKVEVAVKTQNERVKEAIEESPVVKQARFQEKTPVETAQKSTARTTESAKEAKREWPIEKQLEASTSSEKENVQEVSESTENAETALEASSKINEDSNSESTGAKPDHNVFNGLLTKHVSNKGVVNYKGFQGDEAKLDAYLEDLASNTPASDWSRNEKLSYWINAYNAFTIKLILDNYPVNSIQDIAGGKPWDKKWIELGDNTYSLNQIENDIIRPDFNEPRIHFAVNCAAKSCPPLANKAFTANNLNSLLEKQTKAFITNDKYNKITSNSAEVSKIFDWYGKDFSDLKAFLNKYSETEIASGTEIKFTDYDWALNN